MAYTETQGPAGEVLRMLEAATQLWTLPDKILTPETLAVVDPGYEAFTTFSDHVWVHPALNQRIEDLRMIDGPIIVAVTGGIASGKTEIARQTGRPRVRTATTRPARSKEVNKVDYDFLDLAAFQEMKAGGLFAETVPLGEFWYGTPWKNIAQAIQTQARAILCVVEQEGVKNLPAKVLERFGVPTIRVTIIPELKPRDYVAQIVISRVIKHEDIKDIPWRIEQTVASLRQTPQFSDILVGNSFAPGGLDETVNEMNAVIDLFTSS